MKTLKLFAGFLISLVFILGLASCNKNQSGVAGVVQFKAASHFAGVKSASIETANGTITIQSAIVEIQNLQIEENSGSDNQNEDGKADKNEKDKKEGKEGKEKDSGKEGTEGGDILLAGPYVLDVTGGNATIDQVDVVPGTYKKVDFDFVAGFQKSGNSIVVTGKYTSNSGTLIPFSLESNFESTVQLPLSNPLIVSSGSIVSLSIVFDVNSWLTGINFENATQINGKIIIDPQTNVSLYNAFIDGVSKNIDVED